MSDKENFCKKCKHPRFSFKNLKKNKLFHLKEISMDATVMAVFMHFHMKSFLGGKNVFAFAPSCL